LFPSLMCILEGLVQSFNPVVFDPKDLKLVTEGGINPGRWAALDRR